MAVADDQQSSKLVLELLHGARERRLRHVASLGRARKIQRLAQREKVLNLIKLHAAPRAASNRSDISPEVPRLPRHCRLPCRNQLRLKQACICTLYISLPTVNKPIACALPGLGSVYAV